MPLSTPAALCASLTCALIIVGSPAAFAHGEHEAGDFSYHDLAAEATVERNGRAELTFEARENETIQWTMRIAGDTPVYFDIHTHNDFVTETYHNQTNVTETAGEFVVPSDGTYSFYIIRSEAPAAEVTLLVTGIFILLDSPQFSIEELTESSPGAALMPAVFLAGLVAIGVARRQARRA